MLEHRLDRGAILCFHFENVPECQPAIRCGKHLLEDFEPGRLLRNRRFHRVMLVGGGAELLVQFRQLCLAGRQGRAGRFHRPPQVGQAAIEGFEPLVQRLALVFQIDFFSGQPFGPQQVMFFLGVQRPQFIPIMGAQTFRRQQRRAGFRQGGFFPNQFRIQRLQGCLLRLHLGLLRCQFGVDPRKLDIERFQQLFVLPNFFFVGGNFKAVVFQPLAGFRPALRVVADALFVPVTLALEFVVLTDGRIGGPVNFMERPAQLRNLGFAAGDRAGELLHMRGTGRNFLFQTGNISVEPVELVALEPRVESLELIEDFLVPARLAGLPLQADDLAFDFFNDVGQPHQILLGIFELAERFFFLMLVLADPGRFLKNRPPVVRMGAEDLVNLTLRHHGIAGPANAGIHEHLLNIAQPTGGFIDEIFAGPIPINAAGHGNLRKIDVHPRQRNELRVHISKGQVDFRQTDGFAPLGPIENDVGHFGAAEGLGRLFAQHPTDGIGDVGFAAPVRADNRGDTG